MTIENAMWKCYWNSKLEIVLANGDRRVVSQRAINRSCEKNPLIKKFVENAPIVSIDEKFFIDEYFDVATVEMGDDDGGKDLLFYCDVIDGRI